MLLCLDVGNTHIYGGIFESERLAFQFRYPNKGSCTSDELGIFLKSYLKEIGIKIQEISNVALCSVVPSLDYSVRSAFVKYFNIDPFVLQTGIKTGLQIKYKNPTEVGADRIANAIAARHFFPNQNIIIIDLGTTTTFEVLSSQGAFLGGAIIPGLQMQSRALSDYTANLPPVRILKPVLALGQSTMTNIQSGLFYAHLGAMRELIQSYTQDLFKDNPPLVLGTGGFSQLFEEKEVFHSIHPDLVLQGLRIAFQKNLQQSSRPMKNTDKATII